MRVAASLFLTLDIATVEVFADRSGLEDMVFGNLAELDRHTGDSKEKLQMAVTALEDGFSMLGRHKKKAPKHPALAGVDATLMQLRSLQQKHQESQLLQLTEKDQEPPPPSLLEMGADVVKETPVEPVEEGTPDYSNLLAAIGNLSQKVENFQSEAEDLKTAAALSAESSDAYSKLVADLVGGLEKQGEGVKALKEALHKEHNLELGNIQAHLKGSVTDDGTAMTGSDVFPPVIAPAEPPADPSSEGQPADVIDEDQIEEALGGPLGGEQTASEVQQTADFEEGQAASGQEQAASAEAEEQQAASDKLEQADEEEKTASEGEEQEAASDKLKQSGEEEKTASEGEEQQAATNEAEQAERREVEQTANSEEEEAVEEEQQDPVSQPEAAFIELSAKRASSTQASFKKEAVKPSAFTQLFGKVVSSPKKEHARQNLQADFVDDLSMYSR